MKEERGHKRVELRNRTEKLWMSLMVSEDLNVTTVVHHLKTHQESKHEVVRYECDKCDYKATQMGNLKTHKESEHKCVRYECDKCDYKATQLSNRETNKEQAGAELGQAHCLA